MKFEIPFTLECKVKKVITDSSLLVDILETGDFECEARDATLYCRYKRAYIGDIFKLKAEFRKSEKCGYFIKGLEIPEVKLPITTEKLAKYTASQIKGISKATMKKVIDVLGIDFIGKINVDKEEINKIEIKDAQKKSIVDWCDAHYNLSTITSEGLLSGMDPEQIFRAYKRYNSQVVNLMKNNPYVLYITGMISYREAVKMAKRQKLSQESDSAIAARIYKLIEEYQEAGSMAVRKESILEMLEKEKLDEEQIRRSIKYLKDYDLIDEAEFEDGVFIGKRYNMLAERYIADYIKEAKDEGFYSYENIEEYIQDRDLNNQQRDAVFKCLQKKISLLVGGPGTGKTYTIKRILETVKRIYPDAKISLMAPTGKAASRMIEMIGETATTIHAALGVNEGDDLIHKDGMVLEKDLIIIDEASMIDEILFSYFVRHISKRTQVILVGDTGQLPSVEAGNLLEELSEILTVAELTTICRQNEASPIVINAHHIRNKEYKQIEFDDKDFQFIETKDVVETVAELYRKAYKNYGPDNIMVLSPQHNRNGTDMINLRLQAENKNEILRVDGRRYFKRNDRVIQLKNTKALNIHNGDQGHVTAPLENGLEVLFDGKDEPTNIRDLENLELSYCITVHKSQGSEAELVIMVFSKGHLFTLSDKLIYTALTRTKKKFIAVGDKDTFYRGIRKEAPKRISLINRYVGHYTKLEGKTKKPEQTKEVWIPWIND